MFRTPKKTPKNLKTKFFELIAAGGEIWYFKSEPKQSIKVPNGSRKIHFLSDETTAL